MTKETTKFPAASIRPFAERERQVLELLLQGMTSKEMAYVLDLSVRTIDHTVERLCDKAGVATRRELLVWAARSEARAA